ncbi:MAG: hypothetical protein HY401_00880 [Elusimicrobia bacterium]|nr:hypothetical protein [Elusimicrobiota bacterium]
MRIPKTSIATFGPTNFSYYCLSALDEASTRIRNGTVFAQKPQIILPQQLKEMFDGFFPGAREFVDEFFHQMGEKLRALGYHFRHELKHQETTRQSFAESLQAVETRVGQDARSTIIRGPDAHWQVSLLKFTMEMIAKSAQMNVTELQERGFFDPEQKLRHQIEKMFFDAPKSKEALVKLGEFLRENSVFEEYEDRFFELVQKDQPK